MFSLFKTKSPDIENLSQGFTLIEMMVVIAIVIIMTGVLLANFPSFRDRDNLDLVAQEVTLVIRQAQEYGVGTRYSGKTSNPFPSFGIVIPRFDPGETQTSFSVYADDFQSTSAYYYVTGDTIVEPYFLSGGIAISSIYTFDPDAGKMIRLNSISSDFSIAFQRPYPDANFYQGVNPAQLPSGGGTVNYVKLELRDAKQNSRYVCVWNTGHIYVMPSTSNVNTRC